MTMPALLNPPQTSHACQQMIKQAQDKLGETERRLTHHVLGREDYLAAISRAQALRELIKDLHDIYGRHFRT